MRFSGMHAVVAVLTALLVTNPITAYWRMSCYGVAGIGLIDPIVAPGKLASHAHTIKGGSSLSISTTVDDLLSSKCTSCEIKQDKSAYWSPQLFFWDDNGDVEIVDEIPGHLTYYKFVPATLANGSFVFPKAIPNGMRMVSGNQFRRQFTLPVPDPPLPWTGDDATQDALEQKALGFNCLNYAAGSRGSFEVHTMPNKTYLDQNCPDGLRLEVLFPICWNGEDLDSHDHKSHLAYSDAGANGGNCPEGYDHVINQIMMETYYPVGKYKDREGYFVLGNGDPTGCGNHADAFIAWDEGVLQRANDECGPDGTAGGIGNTKDCPVFDLATQEEQDACKLNAPQANLGNSRITMNKLPGNNPVQWGPEDATRPDGNNDEARGGSDSVSAQDQAGDSESSSSSSSDDNNSPDGNGFSQESPASSLSTSTPYIPSPPLSSPTTSTLISTSTLTSTSTFISTTTSTPTTTPAPSTTALPVGEVVLSTKIYTQGNAVYEIVYVAVQATATVTAMETVLAKRGHGHVHQHLRNHVHHPRG